MKDLVILRYFTYMYRSYKIIVIVIVVWFQVRIIMDIGIEREEILLE